MLLNQPDSTTITTTITTSTTSSTTTIEDKPNHLHQDCHLNQNQTSALFAAAQNGHTECVKLLLSSGTPADVSDENGFTPLHFAAARGHSSCVVALLSAGAAVDSVAVGGQTALYLSCEAGEADCVRVLIGAGSDRSIATEDGCTALHAAVRSGQVDTLRLLLCHPPPRGDPNDVTSDPSASLLNQANSDGWTSAHMAAALGFMDGLEVLCSYSGQDIGRRDKWNRTIHDVATDDCKDLLENLDSYRVLVLLQCSGSGAPEEDGGSRGPVALGRVSVDRSTRWSDLGAAVSHMFTSHLQIVCGEAQTGREEAQRRSVLGLGASSISSVLIGDTEWYPGQDLPLSPWNLVRKPLSQTATVRLRGLSESCLDELALQSLLPLSLLHNCIRLVEQYGNLIFHGLEGCGQELLAGLVACAIKSKQEAAGLRCDVVRVEVEESLTKEQLLETFIKCGFLVPDSSSEFGGPESRGVCVVVLLEGLEKASSLSGLLGDLCHSLDNRSSASPLILNSGPHHFCDGNFLIGTLSKPHLQGAELRLQQHFRWVTLRWDQEPLHGLLGRHLRRKLLQAGRGLWSPEGLMERVVVWVSQVWQQLNACLSCLGTTEALLGPQVFLSCPVVPDGSHTAVRWLARLWSAVVVPRVEEAIVSRVTAHRRSSSPPLQRLSPSNSGLSAGQQVVVKAALSILVNKAVVAGCPLPRREMERHLQEFGIRTFPLSAVRSYRGARRGRDGGRLRRSNTSPWKKGGHALSRSSGGSFREVSLSSSDVCFSSSNIHSESAALNVFCGDDYDLIGELKTICSSKSEPDISKISANREHLMQFPSLTSEGPPLQEQSGVQQPPLTTLLGPSGGGPAPAPVQSSDRLAGPPGKSQLPVSSSRGQPTRARSTSSVSSSPSRIQTPSTLSRNKQALQSSNNYHNNVNRYNQSQQDVWILHRDLHKHNNNK